MAPIIISVYGIAAIAAAIAALILGPRRGRNGQSWAFWSFLFPPLAVVLYALRPAAPKRRAGRRGKRDDLLETL